MQKPKALTMNSEQRLTDFTYLKKIAPSDSELIDDMIDLFISNVPDYVDHIKASYQQNDRDTLCRTAHKMKSSVNYMGIDVLFNLLQDVEAQAQAVESLGHLETSIEQICEISNEALDELHYLKNENTY